MTTQNISQNNQTNNQVPAINGTFFNATDNQKDSKMIDIATITNLALPDISKLSVEQKTAYKIEVGARLKRILDILTTGRQYITQNDKPTYCKAAIYLNDWLIRLDVDNVETIKKEHETTKKNLPDIYKDHGLNRKEWENRKDLTHDVIDKITNASLIKLNKGKWSTNDLPTISKALKEIKKGKSAQIETLDKGALLPIPAGSKFRVIYANLADNISIADLSKHIADDAVGFFWLNDSNLQQSLNIINKLGFVVKELAYWDTDKSHNGAFSTKQQHNMVIACKGKSFRPSTFRLDSVFFEYENKNTGFKPYYYAEIIRQMFPKLAVLEIHKNDFKYIKTDYNLADLKTQIAK